MNPKILQVTEALAGGVATHLELALRALPRHGFTLSFLVSTGRSGASRAVERLRAAGAEVEVAPMTRALRPWRDLPAALRLRRAFARLRPAVVHTHASKAGFLGRWAAASLGIPCIHTPHVFPFEWCPTGFGGRLYRMLEGRAARWCGRVVCLSALQMEAAWRAGVAGPERLTVLPNGIDPEEFRPPSPQAREEARRALGLAPDGPVLGMAARLEPQKGVGVFLRAAARTLVRRPDARFLVAGEGALEGECRRRAAEYGLGESIRFLGPLEAMQPFYRALDGFVLASLWEGLPYAILEAQACGLPVLATRTFGAEALIRDGESGLLVPLGDEQVLAEGMLRLLDDPALREKVGAWGRTSVVDHFSLDRWAMAMADLLRSACAWRGAPRPV